MAAPAHLAYCFPWFKTNEGETEQRLYGLDAWRETPYYSDRQQFSEDELVHLSLAIVGINGWNRLNIAARTVPGSYMAGSLTKLHAEAGLVSA